MGKESRRIRIAAKGPKKASNTRINAPKDCLLPAEIHCTVTVSTRMENHPAKYTMIRPFQAGSMFFRKKKGILTIAQLIFNPSVP